MRRVLLVLALMLLAYGVALRVAHPTRALYWNDEVWTALQATGHTLGDVIEFTDRARALTMADFLAFQRPDSQAGFGRFVNADPHTSPIFYTLCWAAVRITNDHVLGTRIVSALLACLALFSTYLAGTALFESRAIGLAAAVVAALSPVQVGTAFEARPYTLWAATAPLATYAFLRAVRAGAASAWLLYGVTATLMLYSHLYGLTVVAAHFAYLFARRPLSRPTLGAFLRASSWAGLACAPWWIAIAVRTEALSVLTAWLSEPVSVSETLASWKSAFLWQVATYDSLPQRAEAPWLVLSLFLAILLFASIDLVREESRRVVVLLAVQLLALPVALFCLDLLLGGRRFPITRYYVPTWGALELILGRFAVGVLARLGAGGLRRSAASDLALAGGLGLLALSSAVGAWATMATRLPEGKPDAFLLGMSRELRRNGPAVIVSPGLVTTPLVLSNLVPADTRVLNLRAHALLLPEVARALRERPVYLVRPAPEVAHPEPRRAEAIHVERLLREKFRLEPSADPSVLRVYAQN